MIIHLLEQPSRRWFALIFIVSAGIHLLAASIMGGLYNSDYERVYKPVAFVLANEQSLDGLPNTLALRYPIGFPLFLAFNVRIAHAIGVLPETVITVTQSLVAGMATGVIFVLANTMFNRLAAVIASVTWGLYPRNLWFTKHPNSEVLFTLCFFLAVLCFVLVVKRRSTWLAGVVGALVGVSALIRPIALLVAPLLVVFLFFYPAISLRQRLSWSLAIVAMNIVVITPWEYHLWQRTGQIEPLSVNDARSIYDGITWAVRFSTPETRGGMPDDVLALMQRATQRESELATSSRAIGEFVWAEFKAQPMTVIKLYMIKLIRGLYAGIGIKNDTALLFAQLPVFAYAVWGLRATWQVREYRWYVLVVATLALYFWAMTTVALSIARYMVPVTGLLFAVAAYPIAVLIHRHRGVERLEPIVAKASALLRTRQ